MTRQTESSDLKMIATWIRADRFHAGTTDADFFLDRKHLCICYEDAKGPVLFVRLESHFPTLVLHVQFAPNEFMRTAKAIKAFDRIAKCHAINEGLSEMKFDTENSPLVNFMERLGWQYSDKTMWFILPFRARKVTNIDRRLFESWVAEDATHSAAGITWDDLVAPNTEAYLITDSRGPVQFVRFERALRVATQYKSGASYRNAKIGHAVVDWFKSIAEAGGMREVITRPGGQAVNFAEHLGFDDFVGKVIGV